MRIQALALFKDLSRATGIVGWVVFSLTKFAHGPARPKIWVFTIHSICGGVGFFFLELGLHYQDKDFKSCRRGISEFDFKGCWRGISEFLFVSSHCKQHYKNPQEKMEWLEKVLFPMRRAFIDLATRIRIRKSGGGLLKLQNDVQRCGYEDVQVMWEMLKKTESPSSEKRGRSLWRLWTWAGRTTSLRRVQRSN